MIKGRVKFGNLYLVAVLFLEVAVFASMIWNAKHLSEIVYFLMAGIVFVIPCLKELIVSDTTVSKTNNTKSVNTSKGDVKQAENKVTELKKYKKKVCTTKGYEEFNNLIKASVQNQLIDRNCILKVKYELRHLLETHIECYKNFKFKNDLHEIYVLSKSSKLKEKDYTYLIKFISDNLNIADAEEVTEN